MFSDHARDSLSQGAGGSSTGDLGVRRVCVWVYGVKIQANEAIYENKYEKICLGSFEGNFNMIFQ